MAKNIVIVESPAKSRTLKKFLGADFDIIASGGHVRDLPVDRLGVNIDKGFQPQYVQIKGKNKIIAELKARTKEAKKIYLASDPDREGEAIAWHIAHIIGKNIDSVERVLFNEITKSAVQEGIKNPGKIDLRKVDAQQARRVLDRLVGYMVSPFLWKTICKGLSAGRVQTVALRLICEREKEIEAFVPSEYWLIHVDLKKGRSKFTAKLVKLDGKAIEIPTQEDAEFHRSQLEKLKYFVSDVEVKNISKNPSPAFITSSLELVSARQLGFTAKRTMEIAQTLYEGVELGSEGPSGLITYMRTDSVRIAKEARDSATKFIVKNFGNDYSNPREFKTSKTSQDAHEAIRPTDPFRTPASIKEFLTTDQYKLYDLIWRRFMASLMSPAVFKQTTVTIGAGKYELNATERDLVFDGFMRVYTEREENGEETTKLPVLVKGDACLPISVNPTQHFTKPPPRYTEGTLIRELEENGIGRPSTYAQIISTIIDRKYVTKDKTRLMPTQLGNEVYALLIKLFPGLFDVGFTADMESKLDKVEEGELDWVKVLSNFYAGFEPLLKKVSAERQSIKKEFVEETGEVCEKCASPMIIKWSKHGKFLACSNYPNCKNTKSLKDENDAREVLETDKICPKCGKQIIVKRDRRGRRFYACSGYPECKYTESFDTGFACPQDGCDGKILEKYSRIGKMFFGCSNYPNCRFASWDPPVEEQCPSCESRMMILRVRKKGTSKKCPKCGYSADVEE